MDIFDRDWLRVTGDRDAPLESRIEIDHCVLRARIFPSGQDPAAMRYDFLYWLPGRGDPSYSMGVDIDHHSRGLRGIELRLYGGGVVKWPAYAMKVETDVYPLKFSLDPWPESSYICDVNDLYELQVSDHQLRIELHPGRPAVRVAYGEACGVDVSDDGWVLAFVLGPIPEGYIERAVLEWPGARLVSRG